MQSLLMITELLENDRLEQACWLLRCGQFGRAADLYFCITCVCSDAADAQLSSGPFTTEMDQVERSSRQDIPSWLAFQRTGHRATLMLEAAQQ